MNPLVYFKEFSANITDPSHRLDSTSSDLALLSHPPHPPLAPFPAHGPTPDPSLFRVDLVRGAGTIMYPCMTERQGIILKDFLKLWHKWKLTSKRPGAPGGVEKATGLVYGSPPGHGPRPLPGGGLQGGLQGGVGSGLQSSRQKLSPLTSANTVQGYTEKNISLT